jgi:repressor LexA
MIGAGISDNDVVVCKEGNDALTGQIVVALVNGDETTLKYYIRITGGSY